MDCRHPFVPAVAGMLLVAGARVHAGEAGTPGPLQVTGGDFPALVMVVPGDHASDGRDAMPGCDRIRARRLDELPPGWSRRVAQVELDCEEALADDAQQALTAVTARARLSFSPPSLVSPTTALTERMSSCPGCFNVQSRTPSPSVSFKPMSASRALAESTS